MITKKLLEQAIESAHDECEDSIDGGKGCAHRDAFSEIVDSKIIAERVANVKDTTQQLFGKEVNMAIKLGIFEGIHIGYRVHELETQCEVNPKIEGAASAWPLQTAGVKTSGRVSYDDDIKGQEPGYPSFDEVKGGGETRHVWFAKIDKQAAVDSIVSRLRDAGFDVIEVSAEEAFGNAKP